MVDREVAEAGIAALKVAAGELMEAAHDSAVSRLPDDREAQLQLISELQQIGRDIAILAEAAEVLIRRSAESGD